MLSDRHRARLRRIGRKLFMRPQACRCHRGDCVSLAELSEGKSAVITCNSDLATLERGLYHGMTITAFRNQPEEPNIVVAVGDARYVLDRRLALIIRVRLL